jgi:hypothetical protein
MNLHTSGIRTKGVADASALARPALVIEDLDGAAEHMVALSTFCIQAEPALPGATRRAGRRDA